jgi:glucose/mannose-6-phosphate isomerase
MEHLIAAFPQNLGQAFESAKNLKFKEASTPIQNVLFLGMGGSGIGAKIVSSWIQDSINVPVILSQEYNIPAFVNKNTLVVACSYSGNTEETVISAKKAFEKGANVVGLCSGGKIKSFCEENNLDCILVPGGNPPRTTTAFSIIHITNILVKFNLIPSEIIAKIVKCESFLNSNISEIKQQAQAVANFLLNKIVTIYSSSDYESIVIRAKQQFNENSKELCIGHVIPEMNHNELVGWSGGTNQFAALFLDPKDLNFQNKKRFEVTIEEAKRWTENVFTLEAKGENIIERTLYFMHVIDWASLYLANLKNVDPVDIRAIDNLKNELDKLAK